MSRLWDVWDNDVLTAEWATAEVRNECSAMKPGIFMDVEVRIMFSYKDFISAMKSAKI